MSADRALGVDPTAGPQAVNCGILEVVRDNGGNGNGNGFFESGVRVVNCGGLPTEHSVGEQGAVLLTVENVNDEIALAEIVLAESGEVWGRSSYDIPGRPPGDEVGRTTLLHDYTAPSTPAQGVTPEARVVSAVAKNAIPAIALDGQTAGVDNSTLAVVGAGAAVGGVGALTGGR